MKEATIRQLLNLQDYAQRASELLPKMKHDYYAGGANNEITVRENEQAWSNIRLRPRFLVRVAEIDLSTTVLGQPAAMPLITAPCAFHCLAHPDGELAVARATSAAGIIQVLSTVSSYNIEDVTQAAAGPRWFQLYCYRDRTITHDLVKRAEAIMWNALVSVSQPREAEITRQKIAPHRATGIHECQNRQ